MANYGIILTPLGILTSIVGAILTAILRNSELSYIGFIVIGFGGFLFIIGLARVVQGKEPKIMGQIIRPKAAARSSAIWAFFIFNLTPFYFPDSLIMYYSAPFPIAMWIEEVWKLPYLVMYSWVPFVTVIVPLIILIGLFFSGKFPKVFNIIFNAIILACLCFWLNFGIQFLLWSFFANKTGLVFFDQFAGLTNLADLVLPLSLSVAIIIISLILIIRMINQLKISFSNLEIKGIKNYIIYAITVLVYLVSVSPLYFGILSCLELNSFIEPPGTWITYAGFLFIGIVIIVLVLLLLNLGKSISRTSTGTGEKKGPQFGLSTAIFLVILFIVWAPIFMPLVDNGQNAKNNSIYNTDWNGWADFATDLRDEGWEVRSIQSSISTISQLDQSKQIICMIGGPNVYYNPISEIPYFLSAFQSNFSMFICEDHGQVETLLIEMLVASLGSSLATGSGTTTPITFIPKGILTENKTGYFYKNPTFPIIKDFPTVTGFPELTEGIDSVVLSQASGFLGAQYLEEIFGLTVIGSTSSEYSFIDVNGDGMYDQTVDRYAFPQAGVDALKDQEGFVSILGEFLDIGIPLGGDFANAVFAIKELSAPGTLTPSGNATHANRVFLASDASWLDNDLYGKTEFDNKNFAFNILEYLSCGRSKEDVIIVFDEAHIRPESGATELTSAATFGKTQGYVNWMSTNPILALFYPLFALYSLRRYIPQEGKKKDVQLHDLLEAERTQTLLRFRTSSFFAQKINWYRQHKRYKQALLQLYRRLERKVNAMLGNSAQRDVEAIMRAIESTRGRFISQENLKRMRTFFLKMENIKNNKEQVENETQFQDVFFEMTWVSDNLVTR